MRLTSSLPTVGSRASSVSFAIWIFFSQNMTVRSASRMLARSSCLALRVCSTNVSSCTASRFFSWRRRTRSFSKLKLSLAAPSCFCELSLMSVLSLRLSRCMFWIWRSSSRSSRRSFSAWSTMRLRFCVKIVARDFRSATSSCSLSALFVVLTSSVCERIQSLCRTSFSWLFCEMAFERLLIVASSGPTPSPSCTPCDAMMLSYWRLSASRLFCLRSISSCLRRMSTCIFSMSVSFACRSFSSSDSVACSTSLCDFVCSVSTRMRASSFSIDVTCISLSRIVLRSFSMSCSVDWLPFLIVVWFERLSRMRFSISSTSWATFCVRFVVVATSICRLFTADSSCLFSDSVRSRLFLYLMYVSFSCSLFSASDVILRSSCATSVSTFMRAFERFVLLLRHFLISWRYPTISLSSAIKSSFCLRSSVSVLLRASSRRCIPMRLVFHCCSNCFFSYWIASISDCASASVSCASFVSSRCAVSWWV
eukprot:PhM_4_TR4241/c0_g1_i1/m.15112